MFDRSLKDLFGENQNEFIEKLRKQLQYRVFDNNTMVQKLTSTDIVSQLRNATCVQRKTDAEIIIKVSM